MKLIFKHSYTAFVLTGILSLGSSFMLVARQAVATPGTVSVAQSAVNQGDNNLPRSVADAVLQDLSRREEISVDKLKITEFSQETWSNGCLGLAQPDEVCTQALVEGWRVIVSDGRQTWVYRTDNTGQNIRLESQNAVTDLPKSVADAVLQAASQQSGLSSQLRITEVERREWSDSCLGLGGPEVLCAAVVVPGWLVTVAAGSQNLVYRTNDSGSVVVLDETANSSGDADINPEKIPSSELPPALKRGVIFRAITTGGFAGFTSETNLLRDGRLIRVQVNRNGTTSQTQISRFSQQQVRQFQQLLEKQQFAQFNGLSYPPSSGEADYITATFSSRAGTTRYTDVNQELLPGALQTVIQAWNQLIGSTQATAKK